MRHIRKWWNAFKTVALAISFLTNMILLIVLMILLMQIFKIKNGILEPLVDGLHRNFVGLDEAVIERTIAVDDQIPVEFDLPLNQQTNVVLTADVPIAANASFTLPGGGGVINGRVDIVLPEGLVLPVQLDMIVPVDTQIPINLPVPVTIPLEETQLHEPFNNLRELLEAYVRILDNLPGQWSEVPDFVLDAIQGEGVYLLEPTDASENPWPGPDAETDDRSTPSDSDQDGVSGDADAGTSLNATATPASNMDAAGNTDAAPAAPSDIITIPIPTATPVEDFGIITPPQ